MDKEHALQVAPYLQALMPIFDTQGLAQGVQRGCIETASAVQGFVVVVQAPIRAKAQATPLPCKEQQEETPTFAFNISQQ